MGYQRADEILPAELVQEIQKYIDGETIYIARKKNQRRKWGERTQISNKLRLRNMAICAEYKNGISMLELSKKYFLSIKSIQRIVYSSN